MIFSLLRVKHWIKNLFMFFPLFFSAELLDFEKLKVATIVFFGFSLVASCVYIINDLFDKEFDKVHSTKKNRPIASGKISSSKALTIAIICLLLGSIPIYYISVNAFLLTAFYFVINLLYSYKLKQLSIIEFCIVASGFVIRILIGGEINDIFLSQWIIIMVFLLSIFIAVSKRRDDVLQYENQNKKNRVVVEYYNLEFLDKIINIVSSVLIVSYLLFISSSEIQERYDSSFLLLTFVFVLLGVFRYNQITYVMKKSGSPISILYSDLFLQLCLVFWGLIFFSIIYV
jgi:decaprenyl-phosphate phosphoribosyltransferase